MVADVELGLLGRFKTQKYERMVIGRPLILGKLFYYETGSTKEQRSGDFEPRISLDHPIKGRIRFTTVSEIVLFTQDLRTSVERGLADERIVANPENFISDAFSGYSTFCGDEYGMVIYKLPSVLRLERDMPDQSE